MEVPCPVPLQRPWSPAGYEVVELSNECVPVVLANHAPKAARRPSSPVGYRVVTVADEIVPRRVTPQLRPPVKRRSGARAINPVVLWGPITVGGLFIIAFVVALMYRDAATPQGRGPVALPEQAVIPRVKVPVAPAAAPAKDEEPEVAGAMPGQDGADPEGPAACRVKPVRNPALDRENLGTRVAFARNPREAARIAGTERKLTFILHVSGNFEEARFT